jgi:protein TonB
MIALERDDGTLRWSGSLVTVLAVHAVIIGTVLLWQARPDPEPLAMPAEAVMVEMAPLPTAPPAPPRDLPPGPMQQEQRKAQPKPAPEPKPTPLQPQKLQQADAALPSQVQQHQNEESASVDVDQTSAPPSAQVPIASQYAAQESLSGAAFQAEASWQSQLLGRLEKYRRYPRAAQRRHHEGIVLVRFTVDRQGQVLDVQLARSSGHESLDNETLATVRRATPLPPPPDEIPGEQVTVSTPVVFSFDRL